MRDLKNDSIIQQCVHKKRAKAFFSYLKDESPNVYIFSFDCQKNMPLPEIPDQSTYYSRQFYLYNFTIVAGSSKSQLNKEKKTLLRMFGQKTNFRKTLTVRVHRIRHRPKYARASSAELGRSNQT